MPLYEYLCADCRTTFEVLTSFEASHDAPLCASCHGANVRKQMSLFARTGRGGVSAPFNDLATSTGESGSSAPGGSCACGGGCGCHN